jgi:hypothetical protein
MANSRGKFSHRLTELHVALLATVVPFSVSCKKDTPHDGGAKESAAVSNPATGASASAPGSFDRCLVGRWKGTQISFQNGKVTATGGANIGLEVKQGGEATLDFDGMAPITATVAPTTFDFSYSGKSTARLATPSPGNLSATSPDYSKVRVTAKVSVPAAGSVELFKGTPVSELEKLAKSSAHAVDELPVPAPATPPPKTIDPEPVFSSTQYMCTGNKLRFQGANAGVVWDFDRSP